MSIRKVYSQKILSGEKLYEFRKSVPLKAGRIYIYETAPTKLIVGSFEFEAIKDTPQNLWQRFNQNSGIDKDGFLEYYKGHKFGYALKIKNLRIENINPYLVIPNFVPPQNFIYINAINMDK